MDEIERIERRVKLQDVRTLISAVQTGSMSKAAKRLATSQPAVSRAISDLEHVLGVRLLDRGPQGIEPTQYGRAIVARGVAAFDELRQGIKDIEFLSDPTAGELRFACSESMADGLVFAVIDRLTRRYHGMQFQAITGGGPPLFDELTKRKVEFVISRMTDVAAEEYMVVETLFNDSWVVAAGSHSPWAQRRHIELADLENEPWVLAPSDGFGSALVSEAFRAIGLKPPKTSVATMSLNLRNRLLATGRFLTMLPGYSVKFRDRYPPLKALPVKLPDSRAAVAVVTLRNRTLSPVAQLFIETMRMLAKQLKLAEPTKL
jgi:DNA-binding transcriptional LysR family regulator